MLLPLIARGANYSAEKTVVDGMDVVRLSDAAHKTQVSIAPGMGNSAYEMKVNGKNILYFPYSGPGEWKTKMIPCAIPFLGPWANRLDEDAYWANDKKYILNPSLPGLRRDQFGASIHGVLYFANVWKVVSVKADAQSARVVSQLEFWKYPDMMAQFPFAHTITMTHRLAAGVLQIEVQIQNHSVSPMPVSVGFHPFFRLHDSPRPEWSVHLPARKLVVLNEKLMPTGEFKNTDYADPQPLASRTLDDIMTDLVRGGDGKTTYWVQGKREKISVTFGPKYLVGVAFTPPDKEAVCLEPMAAITNAFNLAHRGLYKDLQSIAPGGEWKESFWIKPEGV
jgi:aldose 1-epimerase